MKTSCRAKRERVAEGIYRDKYGISVIIGSGKRRKELRFPSDSDVRELEARRLREKADLLDAAPLPMRKGTLEADVPRFLATTTGDQRADFERLLRCWLEAPYNETGQTFGMQPRDAITRLDLQQQITRWLEADYAPNTIKHRLRAIRALYRVLDGEDAYNPTDKMKPVRRNKTEPRGLPIALVEFILEQLADRHRNGGVDQVNRSKVLLRVMATTGLPHIQIERLWLSDIDLSRGMLRMRPRRKGKGSDGRWVSLIPPAVDALRAFVGAGLVGWSFSRNGLWNVWRRAVRRATREAMRLAEETGDMTKLELVQVIPPNSRPYDLRHSFLTEAYRISGDLKATAYKAGHASLQTTVQYTLGAGAERDTTLTDQMAAQWGKPAATAPAAAAEQLSEVPLKMAKASVRPARTARKVS